MGRVPPRTHGAEQLAKFYADICGYVFKSLFAEAIKSLTASDLWITTFQLAVTKLE
jgi:hypothetical protein